MYVDHPVYAHCGLRGIWGDSQATLGKRRVLLPFGQHVIYNLASLSRTGDNSARDQ